MEATEYLGKMYGVYCQATKKIIKCNGESFGGLTQEIRDKLYPMLEAGELYSVINKRNGFYLERIMTKDDAVSWADAYGGCIVVKEILGKTIYFGESKPCKKSAISIDSNGIMTIVRGSVNKEFKEKIERFGVTGKSDEKRALGSYTTNEDEKNYVKGYMYNSIKSAIICKTGSKPRPKKIDLVESIKSTCITNRVRTASRLGEVIKGSVGKGMSKNQKRRLNKIMRAKLYIS